jgi:hypothetical protein
MHLFYCTAEHSNGHGTSQQMTDFWGNKAAMRGETTKGTSRMQLVFQTFLDVLPGYLTIPFLQKYKMIPSTILNMYTEHVQLCALSRATSLNF